MTTMTMMDERERERERGVFGTSIDRVRLGR